MNVKGGGRIPVPPPGASALVKVAVLGGAAVYAAMSSLYNVEGGHRAIVFNRIQGIKDKVWAPRARIPFSLPTPHFLSVLMVCGGWLFPGEAVWLGSLAGAIGRGMWLWTLCCDELYPSFVSLRRFLWISTHTPVNLR